MPFRFHLSAGAIAVAITTVFLGGGSLAPTPVYSQAAAPQLSPKSLASLEKAVEDYNAAFSQKNWLDIVGFIPPKIFEALTGTSRADLESVKAELASQLASALPTGVVIESFAMEVSGAAYKTMADGATLAFVPTTTNILVDPPSNRVRVKSQTLAIEDGGRWYLLRLSPEIRNLVNQVYPDLSQIDLPMPTFERIKP